MFLLYKYLPISTLWLLFVDAQVSEIPESADFLSTLLNVPKKKVTEFSKSFMFSEQDLSSDDVSIILYKSDGNFDIFHIDSDPISIEPNKDVKIIIHGFQSSGFANWVKDMAKAYHRNGLRNILAIDWNHIANKSYITAASLTKMIGNRVGEWLYFKLLHANPWTLWNVHLFGHSLGAQISGFIGRRISEITNGQHLIRKISALDAAAPLFEYPVKLPTSSRIDTDDARLIEGYHTNMGFFGFVTKFGHRDFYISAGGPIQPGCNHWLNMIKSMICSHSLSHEIWTKTIGSWSYVATECSNRYRYSTGDCDNNRKVIMGEQNNEIDLHGTFYISIDKKANPAPR